MENKEFTCPIEHWSNSSLLTFLDDPLDFKKVYIEKVYDRMSSPSAVVGKGCHKALEAFYTGAMVEEAYDVGLDAMNDVMDAEIDFGKTGSREKMLADYTKAMQFYHQESPVFFKVLSAEKSTVTFITDGNGVQFPIPLKCKRDLDVEQQNGEHEVIDYKFVTSYSDNDDDGERAIQAMFSFFTHLADFGVAPKRKRYLEIKKSKNNDNTPQLQEYVIEYSLFQHYFDTFYHLLGDATRQIMNPSYLYLPNPRAMFSGKESFKLYMNGTLGSEAPVGIPFKTEQKTFVEKKFVPSEQDRVQNAYITPEEKIRLKLQEFGCPVKMEDTQSGGSVTMYTCKPSKGVRMSKIQQHEKDIAMALEATSVRILAPIPGTSLVGIEVEKKDRVIIPFKKEHLNSGTCLLPLGVSVTGEMVYRDLAQMPHLLVAGTTGSGKSVFMKVMIKALGMQNQPGDIEMYLIDPKRVEFGKLTRVPGVKQLIYDEEDSRRLLKTMVDRMNSRYKEFEEAHVVNLDEYNAKNPEKKMPRVVIAIDEFADLIMSDQHNIKRRKSKMAVEKEFEKERVKMAARRGEEFHTSIDESLSVEDCLIMIAQKGRASGIHLILGTQRPSREVVTGLLKSNIPTRIAFYVKEALNSKIILDQPGAEKLAGKGDMLFSDVGGVTRLQGLFIE